MDMRALRFWRTGNREYLALVCPDVFICLHNVCLVSGRSLRELGRNISGVYDISMLSVRNNTSADSILSADHYTFGACFVGYTRKSTFQRVLQLLEAEEIDRPEGF